MLFYILKIYNKNIPGTLAVSVAVDVDVVVEDEEATGVKGEEGGTEGPETSASLEGSMSVLCCKKLQYNFFATLSIYFMHVIYITFILGVTYNYNFIMFVYVMLLYLKKQFHSKNKYNSYNLN